MDRALFTPFTPRSTLSATVLTPPSSRGAPSLPPLWPSFRYCINPLVYFLATSTSSRPALCHLCQSPYLYSSDTQLTNERYLEHQLLYCLGIQMILKKRSTHSPKVLRSSSHIVLHPIFSSPSSRVAFVASVAFVLFVLPQRLYQPRNEVRVRLYQSI